MTMENDTRWSQGRDLGRARNVIVSKFSTGEASITVDQIRREFKAWSPREQQDFLGAYNAKPKVTDEDEKIIEFLIGLDDPRVWERIALLSTRHSNKDLILGFLIRGLSLARFKSDFIVALGMVNNQKAIEPLSRLYHQLDQETGAPGGEQTLRELCYCCLALARLTKKKNYLEKLDALAENAKPEVRKVVDFIRNRDLWSGTPFLG